MNTNFFKRKWQTGLLLGLLSFLAVTGQCQPQKSLKQLQEDFVNLKFGMFIHFNIPTFADADWPDPDAPASLFNPTKLDCDQWAKAAKSANMTYGCLTTKHHSGYCIWDTKTTDYNVMNSPLKRDVVREYVNAFRKNGLKTMLYYSILDTHHKIRPGYISTEKVDMVKVQLTELLTNYGEISALVIDGWDAPWSRISYEAVSFQEIYKLVKQLQPNCLLMDLNAAKYPTDILFYTDIKSYEQNAGQQISSETNQLPAMACLPIQYNWFWKKSFPTDQLKKAEYLVNENIVPYTKAYCNFMLNVAPNSDGLIDQNAMDELKKIGDLWKDDGSRAKLPDLDAPIIAENIAKFRRSNASWSDDMWIMDFGNDDDFHTAWVSNPRIQTPWYELVLDQRQPFNAITIVDSRNCIKKYRLQYFDAGKWETLFDGENSDKIKVHRFDTVWGKQVKIIIDESTTAPAIAEFGVYNEER
ncbi:alpha-L-fucosidase [Sunxiuqinia sp. A32]|uniref:alpha-L-fucosidase n=1 Tax=Sunxiuqinia sp. A32 TaxID=3461496 RepID=UPI004045B198